MQWIFDVFGHRTDGRRLSGILMVLCLLTIVGRSQGPSPPNNDQEPLPVPSQPPTTEGGSSESMSDEQPSESTP